ncbi:MAG: hypothetical protein JWM84_1133, partial [Nocardioides sp.]|nr:hypothetical protein [Nocardioides sp.]
MRRRTGRRPGVMVVAPLILGLLAFAPEIPTSAAPAPSPASATDVAGSGAPAEAAAATATATAAERASGDKITRGDADPRRPEVDLPRPVHGDTAIRLLGDQLDEAAVLNKMPADGLVELLSTDGTAWLDSGGRLFYKDPAELSSGAEPQPFAQAPLSETFTLHSKPGALRTIFLDFDGAAASATRWHEEIANVPTTQPAWDPSNNGAAFDNVELTSIQTVWASVAEDYAPFDVDVTTADPGAAAINRSSSADDRYGARALITPSAGAAAAICGSQCGGVAYGSSFGSLYGGGHGNGFGGSDGYGYQQPAWVFPQLLGPNSPKNVAEAASHEVGHQLGLDHDGSTTPGYATPDYYQGHGAWAPIMGVGYDHPVSQWSKGDYTGANRQQDDLGIIRGMLGLRADEAASSIARASALPTGTAYISSRTDTDYYLLGACAAGFTVSANPLASAANLDIKLSLVNGAGTVVTSDDPASSQATLAVANGMGATVSASAGTYYVAVDGVGTGTWAGSGYDDYGSLGAYTMSTTGTCNGAAPTGTPSVPTAAAATASTGDYSLNLSWSAPASNGGSPVTGYVVTRDGDADTLVQLGAGATGYVWPGLAAGTSYSFKVTPLNANGPGATVTVTGTTWSGKTRPSVPQGVFASWQSVAAAGQVSYTPPANPGSSYVAGYDIYRDGLYVGQARSDWLSVNVTTDAFTPGTHTMGVAAVTADGVSDIVTRSFTVPDRPANDAFAQRTALPGASGSTTGDNLESSREAADPAPPTARTGAGRASLWYSWTATSSGTLDLATSSSVAGRDTTLGVYTGAALGALTEVAGADDTSGALAGVRLTVTSGTTYAIAVDGYRQAATGVGPFGLSWSFVAAGPKVTTTSLSAVVTGRTVALRSTVTATAGNPVGSVQYFRGSVSLGDTDVSSGAPTATLTVTDEVRGDHTYTARFVPEFSTLFTTSETSAPATVAATPTTTALQASVDARNVTLTATVTQAVGTPSGLVELFEGTTSVGSGSVTNGAVSVTLTGVVPGEHTYTATYTPYDSQRYDGSGSAARTVTVEGPPPPKATATTLTGSVSGRTASLTATVTTASGGAAGTVQLTDKGVVVATAPVSGGTATFTVDDLPKGLHTFRATHVPADPAAYAASQSSDVVLFVEATASATDLTVSVSGRTVTLQSTVTPASAAAGGSVELRDGATVVGRAWLASGAAQLVLSQVPAGTHDYRATFVPADPQRYDSSLSPTRSVTLAPTPTTTALGSAVGERRVTLVATVASGEGTPSGTVEFREGGTLLATETLASGSASTTLTGVAIGSHDYTATFVAPAGSSYAGSVSAAHTSVVAPSSTATGLTVAVNGRTVSLAATATTTDGTLAGFVEFREGSTLLDTVPLASGAAAVELTDVAPGPHSYRATFVPDSATHAASSSPVRTVTVRVATATDLTASAAGRTVTLDARVTGPGTPAGAVVFRDGAVVVGTSAVSAGAASLALQVVTPGEHTYTATFEATDPAAYATSTSPSRAVTVDRVATTTTLQATASGRTVTLAISVAATSGTPTGTVELRDGATFVETVTLSNGAATPALTSVAFGAHSYTATFVPTGTVHAGSVSEARPTTVLGSTTTILTATASGRTVTLSAAVTSDGTAPAGRVTFYRGGSPITAVDVTDGIATTAQSNVVPGDYTYTAKFVPTNTANHSASEATAPVTVAKVVTTTTLQAAASGRAVTIDTSVTVASGTAAGQVRFREGETLVGTVAVSSGAARLTLSTVAPGEHTYTATFVPNDAVTYAESVSAARTVTVARIATTTGLAAAVDGRTVTLTAIPATSSGTLAGAVELREGDTLLDTVPLSGGSAVLALSGVAPGQHSYTATFVPSGTTHAGSTSLVRTVTVAALSTVTGLTAQVAGRTVTLDGEVTSASGTPAGDLVVRDGTAVVGTVALVDGSATLELTDVTPGAHRFTATFVPSDAVTFAPSTSPASTVTIDPIATTTGLTATYAGGRSLTLDAQVTGASGTPAGRVVFRDGTTVVGTVDAEDGAASLTLPVGPGRHTYLATFVPTDPVTYAGSASAPRTVDADPYATSTSLSASAAGDTVALEARTTAGAAGEVVFREGGDVVGTVPVADASASVTLQGVATGEHAYTATFVPADPATYAGSVSAERTVTVKIPSATALAASVTGRTVTLDADVTVAGSATGEVVFREGDTVLGTVAVDEESATLDVEDVTAGEHRYRATFVPTSTDTVAGSVSPVATATVDPYATATELGATVDGRTVTLDVEVSSADGDPAGALQLSEGDTLLDTVTLVDGAATLDVADVRPGEHTYTARFVPTDAATFAGSASAARTVTVAPAATQISLTASADGRAVTLAADVSSDYGDPRGDVVFREGADVLDTVAVEEGVAALVLSDVDPGEHDYTATFVPSAPTTHAGSASSTQTVTVAALATRTALTVSADVRTVTLSAEVTAVGGSPAGDVVFRESDEVVGRAAVQDGEAALELTDVAPGEHTYTATFVAADEVRHGGSVSETA